MSNLESNKDPKSGSYIGKEQAKIVAYIDIVLDLFGVIGGCVLIHYYSSEIHNPLNAVFIAVLAVIVVCNFCLMGLIIQLIIRINKEDPEPAIQTASRWIKLQIVVLFLMTIVFITEFWYVALALLHIRVPLMIVLIIYTKETRKTFRENLRLAATFTAK